MQLVCSMWCISNSIEDKIGYALSVTIHYHNCIQSKGSTIWALHTQSHYNSKDYKYKTKSQPWIMRYILCFLVMFTKIKVVDVYEHYQGRGGGGLVAVWWLSGWPQATHKVLLVPAHPLIKPWQLQSKQLGLEHSTKLLTVARAMV